MMKIGFKKLILVMTSFVFACILFNGVFTSSIYADIVIVANSLNDTQSMTKQQLRSIFLGQRIKWDDNQRIKVAIQHKTDLHKKFVRSFTQKNLSQFEAWWKRMIFTGKGLPPKGFESEEKLIEYIVKTEGAIGYISSQSKTDNLKTIIVEDK